MFSSKGRGFENEDVCYFHEGLLGKWPWRFNCERNIWWRKVVSARRGEVRGRGTHWKFACRMRWGFGRVSKEAGKSF